MRYTYTPPIGTMTYAFKEMPTPKGWITMNGYPTTVEGIVVIKYTGHESDSDINIT